MKYVKAIGLFFLAEVFLVLLLSAPGLFHGESFAQQLNFIGMFMLMLHLIIALVV